MGSRAEGAHDALPGHLLAGRYLIEREVGRDDATVVYLARDQRLDRPVTVKVLAEALADDPARVSDFLDGARRTASQHNVPQVYDSGEEAGVPFIVMEPLDTAEAPVDGDDTTTVVTVLQPEQAVEARPPHGVVPAPTPRHRTSPLAIFGVLVLLAACAIVALVLITGLARPPQPAEQASTTPSASPTQAVAAGQVRVPDTIGMSEAAAEQAAQASGLSWRLEWRVDPSKPAGVYDQKPAAGKVVDDGAPFVMYAYRTK